MRKRYFRDTKFHRPLHVTKQYRPENPPTNPSGSRRTFTVHYPTGREHGVHETTLRYSALPLSKCGISDKENGKKERRNYDTKAVIFAARVTK